MPTSAFFIATEPGLWIPAKVAIQVANQLGANAVLFGEEFTPESFASIIKTLDPDFVFVESHGFPCSVTGQNVKPVVSIPADIGEPGAYCPGTINAELLEGRVVHFNACWTGARLGEVLVDYYGAEAFFGTKKLFLFLMPEDGKTLDPIAASPFLAEYTVELALFSGMTAKEAHEKRIEAYNIEIEKWRDSNHPARDLLITVLRANMDNAVFYGDSNVRIAEDMEIKSLTINFDTKSNTLLAGLILLVLAGVVGK